MRYYIGNTDKQWFDYLKELSPDDVNFWQPSGKQKFQAIPVGAPFLFKLKSPINKIAGIGFFVSHSLLPIDFAWEVFGEKNGVVSLDEFIRKIGGYIPGAPFSIINITLPSYQALTFKSDSCYHIT